MNVNRTCGFLKTDFFVANSIIVLLLIFPRTKVSRIPRNAVEIGRFAVGKERKGKKRETALKQEEKKILRHKLMEMLKLRLKLK